MSTDVIEQPKPVRDTRSMMMSLPVEEMIVIQGEYVARRKQFRDWIKSQLVEVVHFGFAPGCEPKLNDRGEVGIWNKTANNGAGGMKWYPPEQWTAKPSLYKPGAEFICDLMNLLALYSHDEDGWQQLGGVPGVFVMRCRLFPKGVEHLPQNMIGEGLGVRKVGQKGGDENNAIKMAQKSAMVAAVLNSFGLSDLFTQDAEEMQNRGPEMAENPSPRAEPRVAPRGNRDQRQSMLERFNAIKTRWKNAKKSLDEFAEQEDFQRFVCDTTQVDPMNCLKPSAWVLKDLEDADAAVVALEHRALKKRTSP